MRSAKNADQGKHSMTAITDLPEPTPGVVPNDIHRRFVRAAVYSGVLGGVSQALYGFTPMIVARKLGPLEYGVYSVVMSLSAIVIGVFGLGQNSALHKLVPQFYASDRQRSGTILINVLLLTSGLLTVFCAAFYWASGWIAERLYRDASLTHVFRFCALLMLALTLFNLASGAIAGLQDFKSYNLIQAARNFALLAFAWSGVWLAGLRGALAGQLLASVVGLALLSFSGVRLVRERFPEGIHLVFSRQVLRIIASFILPTVLLTLFNIPTYWWASTMVARHAGFEQVGLLGVAYTLSQATFLIPMNLYTPVMTFLSEAHASAQAEVFSAMVSANLRAMWAFSLPLALAIALFSPLLIGALFSSAYLTAVPLTFALSFTALLMLLVGLINTAITASGHMWHNLGITFGWMVTFVAGGLVCIPRWGAAGAAAVFASTYALYLIGVCGYASLWLQVRFERLVRLVTLTAISFGLVALISFGLRGAIAYVISASMLTVLVVAEWFWIFDSSERERLCRFAASFLHNKGFKPLTKQGGIL